MSELRRYNIALYPADAEYLEATYGYGWSAQVREIIHTFVGTHRKLDPKRKLTIEDLINAQRKR